MAGMAELAETRPTMSVSADIGGFGANHGGECSNKMDGVDFSGNGRIKGIKGIIRIRKGS